MDDDLLSNYWRRQMMQVQESYVAPCDMADYEKLLVWRKAHALALNVHSVATGIRGANYASLRSQMIRAAMSIPANIVEGKGQRSGREFARFLGYSINSSSELQYHLTVARDFRVITLAQFTPLLDQLVEVRRMLHGLQKSVLKRDRDPLTK